MRFMRARTMPASNYLWVIPGMQTSDSSLLPHDCEHVIHAKP
ncbi:MAG: hypothetical protein ACI85K_001412 [Hyphomicrobiaceae bacterium]|jgi:hypothetical protein